MANGRCRMHGGGSTGPRTDAGRARIAAALTTHGSYGGKTQAAQRRVEAFMAETRTVLALDRQGELNMDWVRELMSGGNTPR